MSFYYLATPYTRYPDGHEAAYAAAVTETARLIAAGHVIFSPIVHSHPLVAHGHGVEFSYWAKFDDVMIRAARGVIVCMLLSWRDSTGIAEEIKLAERLGKPVTYMVPGIVPAELGKAAA